jgi:hypothetical protein
MGLGIMYMYRIPSKIKGVSELQGAFGLEEGDRGFN